VKSDKELVNDFIAADARNQIEVAEKYNNTDDIIADANHYILDEVLEELFGDQTPEDRWREFLS